MQTLSCFKPLDLDGFVKKLDEVFKPETEIDEFRLNYLKAEMLSKYVDPDLNNADLVQPAIDKMDSCEKTCQRINTVGHNLDPSIAFTAQRIIGNVLSPYAPFSTLNHCDFSGGATTMFRRRRGHPLHKLDIERKGLDVTSQAEPFLRIALDLRLGALDYECYTHNHGRFATVPKNNETDRPIDIQPTGNIFLQKGVGGLFRRALRKVGINLNDQSINQKLAREGSLSGKLSTIDLSSASDLISTYIVHDLLPRDWFLYLDCIRTKTIAMPNGEYRYLHRFSSMGNGFTFELESLIFYALGKAVLIERGLPSDPKHFSVYGDDIVIDSRAFSRMTEVLGQAGFTVNLKKSHGTGFFRESCGGHYFKGAEVTPFYIKRPVSTIEDGITLLNNIRRVFTTDDIVDPRVYGLWRHVLKDNKSIYRQVYNDCYPEGNSCVSIPRITTGLQVGYKKLRRFQRFTESARFSFYHLGKRREDLGSAGSHGRKIPVGPATVSLYLGSLEIFEPIPRRLPSYGGLMLKTIDSPAVGGAPWFPQEAGIGSD